jgi:hypothetical protein
MTKKIVQNYSGTQVSNKVYPIVWTSQKKFKYKDKRLI